VIVKCELFWIFIEVFQSWRSVVYLFNTGLGSIGASVGRYVMGSLGMIFVIGVLWCFRIYLLYYCRRLCPQSHHWKCTTPWVEVAGERPLLLSFDLRVRSSPNSGSWTKGLREFFFSYKKPGSEPPGCASSGAVTGDCETPQVK
jgi:hypothetical protein